MENSGYLQIMLYFFPIIQASFIHDELATVAFIRLQLTRIHEVMASTGEFVCK